MDWLYQQELSAVWILPVRPPARNPQEPPSAAAASVATTSIVTLEMFKKDWGPMGSYGQSPNEAPAENKLTEAELEAMIE